MVYFQLLKKYPSMHRRSAITEISDSRSKFGKPPQFLHKQHCINIQLKQYKLSIALISLFNNASSEI